MHHLSMIRLAALTLGMLIPGQPVSPAADALNEVMNFRRTTMADTLRFEACRVFTALGRPADFPAGIRPENRHALDRTSPAPCDSPEPPARFPHRVYVDSLALADSMGSVHLTVRRGEWLYRETYSLSRFPGGGWGVRDARIWGAIQVLPPPPHS